jgi:hypothetical protein
MTLLARVGVYPAALPVGSRWNPEPPLPLAVVLRTGRPARLDDFSEPSDAYGDRLGRLGIQSGVAAPIVVEGHLWGAIGAGTRRERFAADTEERMAGFTELVGTALANADSRAQLTASRARIVAAADDTRRRIERDLHDGTQQRLVAIALALRLAQSSVPAELPEPRNQIGRVADELTGAIEELRELARGIHPAILSQGGLGPALRTLAQRAAIPVKVDVRTETRAADRIEVAAYYIVSEALTNTAKHARAACCSCRFATTASAGPISPGDPAWSACATGSRPWADRSRSTAPTEKGRRFLSSFPTARLTNRLHSELRRESGCWSPGEALFGRASASHLSAAA